jgi:hypothetical protein
MHPMIPQRTLNCCWWSALSAACSNAGIAAVCGAIAARVAMGNFVGEQQQPLAHTAAD